MSDPKLRIARTTQPYLFQNGFVLTDLPADDLILLKSCGDPVKGKRGDVLFRQGGFPKSVIWLISGKVKIFQETTGGQRQTLYVYSDGDLIGYRQLIAEEAHPVSAVLLEDSTFILISSEIFRGLINSSSFFTRNVLNALAREFTVWMNRMTAFTTLSVRHRLVLALLVLHEQYRLSGSAKGSITMTRTELAEYVGASLETVVRALNTLKAEKLVQIQGRRILLPDLNTLMDILQENEK
ncbi:MAG TPA: Crp/Fnr family transcriptional regulator [Saprospiraceae bacterium]|nr:Crp/Fnr family transcriptional regulator [Saprospiraceae bacterium]